MPTVEGLVFAYALHPLEPGRFPFRRWRWELWHGRTLVAAGWRVSEREAGRALRRYGTDYAHRLFGLRRELPPDARPVVRGTTVRVEAGAVSFVLAPVGQLVPA